MAKNPAFHGRTKHVDVHHHFFQKLVTDGKIVLKFYNTNEQVADVFTKSLIPGQTSVLQIPVESM